MTPPTVVAHRGASATRPENTLSAFDHAKALGATALEFDVHATADGALVVHHDYSLDRTTSGSGLVLERDLDYIRSLDAGSWFDPACTGERVPLLDEVLGIDGVELELELKGFGAAFAKGVLEEVLAHDGLGRTEFTSWDLAMLIELKRQRPDARTGLFSRRREAWMPDTVFVQHALSVATLGHFDVIHVYASDVTPSTVEQLHAHGFVVHANDAADAAQMRSAVRAGADRFSADEVELALEVANGR
ncbi:MAG: glycerophosphodiester phosphodiesterase [Acidimicrobiales bacterium]